MNPIESLEQKFGRSMTPTELSEFLGIDTKTVRRNYRRWGGVAVSQGRIRFFEKRIMEVLDAEFDNQARPEPVERPRPIKASNQREAISGRQQNIRKKGNRMGGRGKVSDGISDPHGLLCVGS